MKNKIAILPGDGVGKEVIREAKKVLEAIAAVFDHDFSFEEGLIGAAAIEADGDPFPLATENLCKKSHAILFGAIGDPKYDHDPLSVVRPEQGLLKMRENLGLFANVRPVVSYPSLFSKSPLKDDRIKDVDFVVYRELTGGIYFGTPRGRSEDGFQAYDTCHYDRGEISRIARMAFEAAQTRKGKLTLVDKANVMATSRLWRDEVTAVSKDYADVTLEFMYVDNAAMKIITQPSHFDVILTENLFGDILTDEASVLSGSLGLIPSASIGHDTKLFEPIHGSYPEIAGQNVANPLGAILSAALLLELALMAPAEAQLVREAVKYSMEKGVVTRDIDPENFYSTSEVGEYIADFIYSKNVDDSTIMTII